MRRVPTSNPRGRFDRTHHEHDGEPPPQGLVVHIDSSREILSRNDSPDIPFTYSVNPYRGCLHACAYCYARPTHEYLGFGAGTDFDLQIVVKPEAPALLREAFERRSWQGDTVVFSGVTDCYQPIEAEHRLTRGCLEVCLDYRNPVAIITKSSLIERDADLLIALAREARASVCISVPFLDEARARRIEPYAPAPARRIRTIERLSQQGIDVTVFVAPVIPGLNDEEIPAILEAAKAAGARRAAMQLVRLPGAVATVFEQRIEQAEPLRAKRVLARIRDTRGGAMNDSRFGDRHRGEGHHASMIERLFSLTTRRLGLGGREDESTFEKPTTFRRPTDRGGQLRLFD